MLDVTEMGKRKGESGEEERREEVKYLGNLRKMEEENIRSVRHD